jgi:hypothetical protein
LDLDFSENRKRLPHYDRAAGIHNPDFFQDPNSGPIRELFASGLPHSFVERATTRGKVSQLSRFRGRAAAHLSDLAHGSKRVETG